MKKVKAIYVLDEISNDENFRPTVKFRDMTYKYDKSIGDYTNDFNSEYGIFSGWAINLMLNEEVEILEDNTEEMKEIDKLKSWRLATNKNNYEAINNTLDRFGKKIDELVKAVNKLMKEGKE